MYPAPTLEYGAPRTRAEWVEKAKFWHREWMEWRGRFPGAIEWRKKRDAALREARHYV